jgi:arginyl-tRNA synthetase
MVKSSDISINPFKEFRGSCETMLKETLNRVFPDVSFAVSLETPRNPEFGELSSSICFELARQQTKTKPIIIAEDLVKSIDLSLSTLVQSVKAAGEGYVNFYVKLSEFSRLVIESVRKLNMEYGQVKVDKPIKIIVEHTSVNPIHPIHIGQARNPILGDSLARLLKTRGHIVFSHYYIDDVGRQTAVIAYGYGKLGKPKVEGKTDHFIGEIYSVTNCLIEINRLKKEIERSRTQSVDKVSKLQRELDEWVTIAAELENKSSLIFKKLADALGKDVDPESEVSDLIRRYEASDEKAKQLIREVSQLCLEGFKKTLERVGIFFDSWDWESDFVWSSDVKRVLNILETTPYVFYEGDILEFDAEKVAVDLNLKKTFGIREDYQIPSLTLLRADGTTLYTTRDVAYSVWKFKRAERVINVVGMDQPLAQLQMKLALAALGYIDYAKNLTHFAYNLISLPGFRMSSRRGHYVSLDEVLDEAVKLAYEEVAKRSPNLSDEEKQRISNFVGIGAVKYALVEVDPSKPVVFSWDRVLDFEKNSAPYTQYSHARAGSILRKANRQPHNPDYSLLTEPLERDLVLTLAKFPDTIIEAADNLRPNNVAEYVDKLADKFNSFYTALPVIKAKIPELSDARLALVEATNIVLRNALKLLGIEAPEKM